MICGNAGGISVSSAKTNAMRMLDSLGITYDSVEYDVDESDLGGMSVAAKIGLPREQVFKTLVTRGDRTGVLLAGLPVAAELDLKKLAVASGNKRVETVPLKEVLPLTGYVRGGVSPLGAKKAYPYYLDESATGWPRIAVSAGVRGRQIFISPEDLARASKAVLAPLTR